MSEIKREKIVYVSENLQEREKKKQYNEDDANNHIQTILYQITYY